MIVIKRPHSVSLENFYPFSEHPDIATFQAALVKGLNAELEISGVYDLNTGFLVKDYHQRALDEGIALATKHGSGAYIPNENFTRMIGLSLRTAE